MRRNSSAGVSASVPAVPEGPPAAAAWEKSEVKSEVRTRGIVMGRARRREHTRPGTRTERPSPPEATSLPVRCATARLRAPALTTFGIGAILLRGLEDATVMSLDRRQVLASGGVLIVSCGARRPIAPCAPSLDALLEAQARVLPEAAGAGANHYPMAAEALEALGHPECIPEAWRAGAAGYAGPALRVAAVTDGAGIDAGALGDYGRYGDWLEHFRAELARVPWREVVARWVPRLAPGVSAAIFHGVIRTAHATRALRRRETRARLDELRSEE